MTSSDEKDDGANGGIDKEIVKGGVEIIKTAYDDAVKPVAKEVGKALGTVGRTINVVLAPVRALVWSWEQIEEYVSSEVERKLKERNVPSERIISPNPDIAVPAMEAMRYSKLRENFMNLLVTSMDAATAVETHPSYVEILKQLTPDEAKILAFLPRINLYEPIADMEYELSQEKGAFTFLRNISTIGEDANCDFPDSAPMYIGNLCRLGLTEVPPQQMLKEKFRYDRIKKLQVVNNAPNAIPEGSKLSFIPRMFGLTVLGSSFRTACISEPSDA